MSGLAAAYVVAISAMLFAAISALTLIYTVEHLDGADERGHARALRLIVGDQGAEGPFIARLEGRHRTTAGNALRAAVLGANDGIVSTASLVIGVATAHASRSDVLLAGVAGMAAGALSMAAGEYVSVSSQADTERADIELERRQQANDLPGEVGSWPRSTCNAASARSSLERSRNN